MPLVPVSRMYAPTFHSFNAAPLAAASSLPKVVMADTTYDIVTPIDMAEH